MAWRLERTHLVGAGMLGLLAGLYAARYGLELSYALLLAGFASLPLIARFKLVALVPALVIGWNIGLWRGSAAYQQLQNYIIFKDQKITIVASVENDAAYADRGQLEFIVSSAREESTNKTLPGSIRVRGFNAPSVRRADVVRISGKLREGFGSRQGFISYAEVEVISRDTSWLETLRAQYFAGTLSVLPEPHASLGLGFLVGTRSLLPDGLLTSLSATGLTHIVAVSGYNLTILVRLTRRLLANRSLYLSTVTSLGLITGFVLVTGQSPSIVRATVVSALAIMAWYYGREIKPAILLLAAASITAMMNPYFLWSDLGWYLSFAAFSGILILAPLLSERISKTKPKLVGQLLLETTCAQVMTLPIIMFSFSQVSVISLLANLVVLPLIPLAMLATFLAGVAGMTVPVIGGWVAWPAKILLTFIIDVVNLLAGVPGALQNVDLSHLQMAAVYLVIAIIILGLKKGAYRQLNGAEVIE